MPVIEVTCFFLIPGSIYVNDAKIIEREVFVYNLGTMFYVEKVLFAEKDKLPPVREDMTTTEKVATIPPLVFSARPDGERVAEAEKELPMVLPAMEKVPHVKKTGEAEKVPEELTEEVGTMADVLLQEDGTTRPILEDGTVKISSELPNAVTTEQALESTEMYVKQMNE